jgi:hypothetical protein
MRALPWTRHIPCKFMNATSDFSARAIRKPDRRSEKIHLRLKIKMIPEYLWLTRQRLK